MDNQLLSVKSVAEKFNVSTPTVYRWLKAGKLKGKKVGGQWRFDSLAVQQAFVEGDLAVDTVPKQHEIPVKKISPPLWAKPILSKWSSDHIEYLESSLPDQVVVNDRRGAKIWDLISKADFEYAKNLWHSSAINLMPHQELYTTFSNKKVLLFDEMMQHGREMNNLRQKLANLNCTVESLVCFRRKSHIESGGLIEYRSHAFENLDNNEFEDRVAFISRLMDYFEPPLDVGHLVVRGKYIGGDDYSSLLKKMSNWGIPLIIRCPDREHNFLTLTLDRPQFFDTSKIKFPKDTSVSWEGPCKIRFYINTENQDCLLSFISFPSVTAQTNEFIKIDDEYHDVKKLKSIEGLFDSEDKESKCLRVYEKLSMDVSIHMLEDFIFSGASQEFGIRLNRSIYNEDLKHMLALFGNAEGRDLEHKINSTLATALDNLPLFKFINKMPPPLFVRGTTKYQDYHCDNYDTFKCRNELLKTLTTKYDSEGSKESVESLDSYKQLLHKLAHYSEGTIGKVLDFGLDWGLIKPSNQPHIFSELGVENVNIERAFGRGEFGAWFETESNTTSHRDTIMQKTIALGPVALSSFLKWYKLDYVTSMIFYKIFSNLQHDWSKDSELLFLGWRPYKFGPVPVWPTVSGRGDYPDYKNFLLSQKCIEEKIHSTEKGKIRLYKPQSRSLKFWQNIYNKRVNPVTRVIVSSLTRLYSIIQQTNKMRRLFSPYSDKIKESQDALVVLSAARNEKITYICAYWEVEEWIRIGKDKIISQLQLFTDLEGVSNKYYFLTFLNEFQEPVRLLFDKLEMYKNINVLYKSIENIKNKENIEIAEVLLDKIDEKPIFRDDGEYPVGTLLWFCKVAFSYTFLLRQIMSNYELDIDQRYEFEKQDKDRNPLDAKFYLNELIRSLPELSPLKKPLLKCIELSTNKKFDDFVSQTLSNAFHLIVNTIGIQERMPNPLSDQNRRRNLEVWEGTIAILSEIPMDKAPYAIAVADIKNLVNLPKIASDIFNLEYDDAVIGLLGYIKNVTEKVAKKYSGVRVAGFRNDNIFIYGRDPNEVLDCINSLISTTTKQIKSAEEKLQYYGLLRVGIAWKEDIKGDGYKGIQPGFLALKIGDRSGLKPGTISITQDIYERLADDNQSDFISSGESSQQGKVYRNESLYLFN